MKTFPLYYFPPISWFAALNAEDVVQVELFQHYRKQQYFNRMRIKGPNGVQTLSIPVRRSGDQTSFFEKEISYAENWQKIHWKSLETAYRNSPYFEYYEDRIQPFFQKRPDRLCALNQEILAVLMNALGIETDIHFTSAFEDIPPESDMRSVFHPKGKVIVPGFCASPYTQVFGEFAPDLSVLDLLFNLGPESFSYLEASYKHPSHASD